MDVDQRKPNLGVVLMVFLSIISCCSFFFSLVVGVDASKGGGGGRGLSFNYYATSCPQVETIVSKGLEPIFLSDPTSAAALLRLLFHDCQVKGCDASILLDMDNSEMSSSKNFGIRKRETIGILKSMVDAVCPGQVSCADILVLAARDAVVMSGGPLVKVPLGRKDSTSSSYKLADQFLPPASSGVNDMLRIFAAKGMNIDESVAILGAHTLGISHCVNIVDRIEKRREKGNGFESSLGLRCPLGSLASNSTFVGNDITLFFFDNQYYRQAIRGQGVLKIDVDMSMDPRTAPIMARFANDQDGFFQTFSSAFQKLSSTNVLTGNEGVVRKRCNEVD